MTNETLSPVTHEILRLFQIRGQLHYGEDVTQLEHATQCAALAKQDGRSDAMVVSALLHDIGHLIYGDHNAAADGEDDAHEMLGQQWLMKYFGPEVYEPVRLHVEAKRYLCTKFPDYANGLSQASVISLELQGGRMSERELANFEAEPFFEDAVVLRRYDDHGKQEVAVPGVEAYVPLIEGLLVTNE